MVERARIITAPEPGFFKMRLGRGAPFVAARIYRPCPIEFCLFSPFQALDRHYPLAAEIDGTPSTVDSVWLYGRPIPWREFEFLNHRGRWARAHAPDHPAARPREAVNLGKMPPVF